MNLHHILLTIFLKFENVPKKERQSIRTGKKIKIKFSGRAWRTLSLTKSAEISYLFFKDQTAPPAKKIQNLRPRGADDTPYSG